MFDLEREIAGWRWHMVQEGVERPEVLDELEAHLRSEIERRLVAGSNPELAFKTAVQQMGEARIIKLEFEKDRDCQPAEVQKLLWVCCLGFAALVSLVSSWMLLTSGWGWTKTILGVGTVSWTACYLGSLPYVCSFLVHIRNQALRETVRIILVLACPVWTLPLLMPAESRPALNLMYALAAIIPLTILAISWSKRGLGRMNFDPFIFPSDSSFSQSACRSLELARREASQLHHDFVGTEHVLLGLLEHESVSEVLRRTGLDRERVRGEILRLVRPGSAPQVSENLPWTPRVIKTIRLARREARVLNTPQVSPEHVLLGLIHEGSGVAFCALNNLGLNLDNARKLVRKFE